MRAFNLTAPSLAIIAMCLTTSPTVLAQAPDEDRGSDPIIQAYRAKLPMLIERYSTNRKIRTRDIRYVVDPNAGEQMGDVRVNILGETITDGKQIKGYVIEGKFTDTVQESRKTDVNFWRPDMRFDVTKQGNKFKIVNQALASTNYSSHEPKKYFYYVYAPMLSGGSAFGTSLWFDQRAHKSVPITVVGVNRVERNGRECIEVRTKWDNRHGLVEFANTYLDPANDFITVAGEMDWKKVPIIKKGEKNTGREFRNAFEVEYSPSVEGYPLPKFIRYTTQYRGEPARKGSEVEFLSYEKYTPSPEDFQLEKEFGLTTPAVVAFAENTALAPVAAPRRWWPWLAVGAGLILAGVTIVILRRNRQRSVAQPAPAKKATS